MIHARAVLVAMALAAGACGGGTTSPAGADAGVDAGGAAPLLRFVPERGYHDAPLDVTITTSRQGAAVRYTLDGSDPRTSPAARAYTGPVRVDPASTDGRLINGQVGPGVVVRAVAMVGQNPVTPVIASSYLFADAAVHQVDSSGGGNWGSTAMDPTVVADPGHGPHLADGLRAIPTLSLVLDPEHIFGANGAYRDPQVEHLVSLELIDPAAPSRNLQINGGLSMAGDSTEPKQSLTIHFRGEYGAKTLDAPLMGDLTVARFDTLRLRASGQDKWLADGNGDIRRSAQLLRDEFGRRSQAAMGWDAPIGGMFHLYINGVYWGVYNVIERPDEHFAELHFGGDSDDYDYLKDRTGLGSGTLEAWNQLMALTDLADAGQYAAVQELLDLEAFADYTLLQMWGGNTDWPGRNWVALRKSRNRAPGDPLFRFMVWDFDLALRLPTTDLSATTSVEGLHGRLLANPDYRARFIARVVHHLVTPGGALTASAAGARYQAMASELEPVIALEAARWGKNVLGFTALQLIDEWHAERARLQGDYFPVRTATVLEQLGSRGLAP
jgi:hypothetical protein